MADGKWFCPQSTHFIPVSVRGEADAMKRGAVAKDTCCAGPLYFTYLQLFLGVFYIAFQLFEHLQVVALHQETMIT